EGNAEGVTPTAAEHRQYLEEQEAESPEDDDVHDAGRLVAAEKLFLPEGVHHHVAEARGQGGPAVVAVVVLAELQQIPETSVALPKENPKPREEGQRPDERAHNDPLQSA